MKRVSSITLSLPLLALVLSAGCSFSPPAVVFVTLEYPGASPQNVDDLACVPIGFALNGSDSIVSITCISDKERGEIYVQGRPGVSYAELSETVLRRIGQNSALPAGCTWSLTDISGQPIPPPPKVQFVDTYFAHIDRDKMAALGVSTRDALAAVNAGLAERGASVEELANLVVTSASGEKVLLRSFVTFKPQRTPDHVIRHFPPLPTDAPDGKTPDPENSPGRG